MEFLNYFSYNSKLVLTFFFISLGAIILKYITNGASNRILFSSYRSSPFNPLTYVRLFTHIFGHEDWRHFSGNFLYILLIGPILEEKYGFKDLLIMITITAGITGIINTIFSKHTTLGASGIVFMMIVLSSFVNVADNKIPLTLILICLFYVVNEIIDAVSKEDNVSHIGHIIGALCGAVFGFIYYSQIGILNILQ